VSKRIAADVNLDWIMITNGMNIHSHPADLIDFMRQTEAKGTAIINSAVFNGGFLTGGDFYNYRSVNPKTKEGEALYTWRSRFYETCLDYHVDPASACVKFGLCAPAVISVALNTTSAPAQNKI